MDAFVINAARLLGLMAYIYGLSLSMRDDVALRVSHIFENYKGNVKDLANYINTHCSYMPYCTSVV